MSSGSSGKKAHVGPNALPGNCSVANSSPTSLPAGSVVASGKLITSGKSNLIQEMWAGSLRANPAPESDYSGMESFGHLCDCGGLRIYKSADKMYHSSWCKILAKK